MKEEAKARLPPKRNAPETMQRISIISRFEQVKQYGPNYMLWDRTLSWPFAWNYPNEPSKK